MQLFNYFKDWFRQTYIIYGLEVEYQINTSVPGFEHYFHSTETWRIIYRNGKLVEQHLGSKNHLDNHIHYSLQEMKNKGYVRFGQIAVPWHNVTTVEVTQSKRYYYSLEKGKRLTGKIYIEKFPWETD